MLATLGSVRSVNSDSAECMLSNVYRVHRTGCKLVQRTAVEMRSYHSIRYDITP